MMSKINEIYERMESYLMGELYGEDEKKFEEEVQSNDELSEDLMAMEVEMYEHRVLPPSRRKFFEERLKYDKELVRELALYIATFEAIKNLDSDGNRQNISPSDTPSSTTSTNPFFAKKIKKSFFQVIWNWFK
ncbi:MAG: hypothetical protein ACPG49_05250 [Chitinophagales bacterium]